ncbi:MAG: 16S rRNA (adenine(1518)-N(6)/adenine(1519)-N(6))-dimethyltransferase RsmA [Bacteroidaceae bacterium]|nr:16S rRNA (adenine(1518)-N(6)/adenine(1519)-N(6))-dimethyltransferase RsmA [Bacteroidaceae bacterium]
MKQVHPKKNLGQHFLTDMSIASRIADTVDVEPDLPVLEIGPGMGALTQFLIPKQRELNVVEIDPESNFYLKEHFPMLRGSIIEDDFLHMNLDSLFDGKKFVLTGNYPYNISSQIFFRLLEQRDRIPCCTGMIQKEVAERLTSGPGKKSYGILSVLLQAWFDAEYLFTVPETVFNPPPKVKSAVVRFRRNQVTNLGCDERLFKRVVKSTFNQRRKMMRGSLRPLLAQLDAERGGVADMEKHMEFLSDVKLTRRPEQLSVNEFVALTNSIDNECH